jgi:ureidoglycolate lyase
VTGPIPASPARQHARLLHLEPATIDSVAAFGEILGAVSPITRVPAFYAGSVRHAEPTGFVMDEDIRILLSTVDRRPFRVDLLERHFKHTQAFFPIGGKPFAMVMAPPNDQDLPDLDLARAFLFDGSGGFILKLGTWHDFPFALEDSTHLLLLLRNETSQSLAASALIEGEAVGPDIEKRDISRRLGVTLEFELPSI